MIGGVRVVVFSFDCCVVWGRGGCVGRGERGGHVECHIVGSQGWCGNVVYVQSCD